MEVWTDQLGLAHTWGDAADLFANADFNNFDKIKNAPENFPQLGDIIIWDHKFNTGAGHTGVATGQNTDVNKLDVFEQNDPLGSACHLKSYNYAYIIGWLRPKIPADPVAVPAPTPTPTPPSAGGVDAGSILMVTMIRGIYDGLVGDFPTDDETKYRVDQLNSVSNLKQVQDIVYEICSGDARFYAKWVAPTVAKAQGSLWDKIKALFT